MGMTMSQKVLAAHAGLKEVKAGQLIEAKLDLVLGNDITSPVAINVFEGCQANSVFDNTKVAMVMDHFTPNKDIYDDAFEELKARRNKAEYDAMIKHSELIKKLPRVQEIEESLAKTSTMAARAVFADRISVREMLEKLKTQNLALQMELKTILEKNGYQSDYLDVHYSCKECSDKGYIDGKMCLCLKKLLREKAYDKLNSVSPLSLSDFKTFSLDYLRKLCS